jgi:acyl carrier protein phosphodiesterase
MNYLAHIFLSGGDTDVQLGNFMGDAIKGKKYLNYEINLQKGILLHRQIDSFTDQHPIVRQSKKRLHTRYGHYAGVLIDIFYDHFLASNWSTYSNISLSNFISEFYKDLEVNHSVLPNEIKDIAPKIIASNWLAKYENIDGIAKTLQGMEERIIHNVPLHLGIEDLKENYKELNDDFNRFFPLLQTHSKQVLQTLQQTR